MNATLILLLTFCARSRAGAASAAALTAAD
jgi:hypothetical protein